MASEIPGKESVGAIAGLAAALADETRLRLLLALLDGDATVSDLAARLDAPQPRISAHLMRLRAAGLVQMRAVGRQRICHVERERIGPLLAALGESSGAPPARSLEAERLVRNDAPIRQARRCYDHLAGVAGVGLLDALLERGWLAPSAAARSAFALTAAGREALAARGVDLAATARARRRFATACLDWTERRPHLGGALGAAVLRALQDQQVVAAAGAGRTLSLLRSPAAWLDAGASLIRQAG